MSTESLDDAAPDLYEGRIPRNSTVHRYERLWRLILMYGPEKANGFSAGDVAMWSRYQSDYHAAARLLRALVRSGRIEQTSGPNSRPIRYQLKANICETSWP